MNRQDDFPPGCLWAAAIMALAMVISPFTCGTYDYGDAEASPSLRGSGSADLADPGVGRSSEASQPLRLQVDGSNLSASKGEPVADAGLSQPEVSRQGVKTPEDSEGRSPLVPRIGDSPVGRVLPVDPSYELDPGMEPTWQGLYSMTVEQWDEESFRETTSRYRLPTEEECKEALEDAKVQRLLDKVCYVDLLLVELGPIPRLVAERDALRAALMRRLDEVSTYLEWALMDKLYGEWSH